MFQNDFEMVSNACWIVFLCRWSWGYVLVLISRNVPRSKRFALEGIVFQAVASLKAQNVENISSNMFANVAEIFAIFIKFLCLH